MITILLNIVGAVSCLASIAWFAGAAILVADDAHHSQQKFRRVVMWLGSLFYVAVTLSFFYLFLKIVCWWW